MTIMYVYIYKLRYRGRFTFIPVGIISADMCVQVYERSKKCSLCGFSSSSLLLHCFGNTILASTNTRVFELKTVHLFIVVLYQHPDVTDAKTLYKAYSAEGGTNIYKTSSDDWFHNMFESIHLTFPFPEENVWVLQLPTHRWPHAAICSIFFD